MATMPDSDRRIVGVWDLLLMVRSYYSLFCTVVVKSDTAQYWELRDSAAQAVVLHPAAVVLEVTVGESTSSSP